MKFSHKEIFDLVKAWVIISFAFAIVFKNAGDVFINIVLMSLITVGAGFLLHELAHKFVAQHFGVWAEFRSNDQMLLLALVMSFFGFVFAAPGGVWMPKLSKNKEGLVSLAGPLTNIFLAILFFVSNIFYVSTWFSFGMNINCFLAIFNLIPFPGFDGRTVFDWNKIVWGSCILIAGIFLYLPSLI